MVPVTENQKRDIVTIMTQMTILLQTMLLRLNRHRVENQIQETSAEWVQFGRMKLNTVFIRYITL